MMLLIFQDVLSGGASGPAAGPAPPGSPTYKKKVAPSLGGAAKAGKRDRGKPAPISTDERGGAGGPSSPSPPAATFAPQPGVD